MDERSTNILYEILRSQTITEEQLTENFSISKRQLNYSIQKINDWLEENGQSLLEKNKKHYRLDQKVFHYLEDHSTIVSVYIPSSRERALSIILMVLMRKNTVQLSDFSERLSVTKKTILKDIKFMRTILKHYSLTLKNTRMDGYTISGKEWNKRNAIQDVIRELDEAYKGDTSVKQFMDVSSEELVNMKSRLKEVEKEVGIHFTDNTFSLLPLDLLAILRRIEKQHWIDADFLIDFEQLSDTREYRATKLILVDQFEQVSQSEKIYMTLQILSSQSQNRTYLNGTGIKELTSAMRKFIKTFEFQAAILVRNRENLLKKLLDHFIPAYYRIKFNLRTSYDISMIIQDDFKEIYAMVQRSIRPLEEYMNIAVPHEEVIFLALIIGGHLLGETIQLDSSRNIKAVVVCPNGVTFSQLIENDLMKLLPDIYFYPSMSIREFKQTKKSFDIVFSTVPLETMKKLYIVNEVMKPDEKKQLRYEVDQFLKNAGQERSEVDELLEIIRKYAVVQDESRLRYEIVTNLIEKSERIEKLSPSLESLLVSAHVQYVEHIRSWEEGIEIAAVPLIRKRVITPNYVQKLKERLPDLLHYAILYEKLALPHLGPEEEVSALGMSLLCVKSGIDTPKGINIHFIVVLTPIDKKQHLAALLQLVDILKCSKCYQQLLSSQNSGELFQNLQECIKEIGT